MKMITILFVSLALLAGCNSGKKLSNSNINEKIDGTWELVELDGQAYTKVNSTPFIKFIDEQNRISGKTGCNSFSGEITINGNEIDLTKPMMMTKMYCEGVDEKKFMDALQGTKEIRIDKNGRLELLAGKEVRMAFVKAG